MSPEQRARLGPALFVGAGVFFALASARGGGALWSVAFGVVVGVVVATYGALRWRAVAREQRARTDDDDR